MVLIDWRVLTGRCIELTVEGVGACDRLVEHATDRIHVDGVVEPIARVGVRNGNRPVLPAVLYTLEQKRTHLRTGSLLGQELRIDYYELVAQSEDVVGADVEIHLA